MKLSLKEKLLFATGNLGIALITVIHMLFLVFIFFPDSEARLDYMIPQESFFLGLTILGLILFGSRLFDAFTDPWIASISDRSKNKRGKRLPFMRKAAIPMGLSYVLVFFVPFSDGVNSLNILWLGAFMILSALFLTLYSIPYYTLMVDMAKSPEDKVDLGTFSSAFWFIGFIIVSFTTSLWEPLERAFNLSRLGSMQVSFIIITLVGVILLFIPTIFLDEKNYESKERTEKVSIKDAIKTVSKNKSFVAFFFGNTAYGTATYFFETGLIYYITVLALLDEGVQGPLTTVIGILTLASYPLINKMAKKVGKKPVMLLGFVLFMLTFLVVSALGLWGIDPWILLVIVAVLIPFSQAAFGILPGVMTADCAAYDLHKNKEENSGMYVAAMGFSAKLGGSIATILFTSFLLLGKNRGDDLGIRVGAVFAAILSVIGIITMLRYNENKILSYAKEIKNDENCKIT